MKTILTAEQMKECDSRTISGIGISASVLMERAALAIADEAMKAPVFRTKEIKEIRVLAVCGPGNNGGDGAAAARILTLRGVQSEIFLPGSPARFSEEMQHQLSVCGRLKIRRVKKPRWEKYDILIDALFGTGLAREPAGEAASAIEKMNASEAFVISADVPSGIPVDGGSAPECAVHADVTVTMQFAKPGLLVYPTAGFAGKVVTADIGIVPFPSKPAILETEDSDLLRIPARDPSGNKGTFGKVLVVAGRKNMAGAAVFAGLSALRTGAGMVKILTPEENRKILQIRLPEAMLETYGDEPTEENIRASCKALDRALQWADVTVCGPGLKTDGISHALTERLLEKAVRPLVLDADALNCLQGRTNLLKACRGKVFVTPHPGEMSRLTGKTIREITDGMIPCAAAFAGRTKACCILKGARTVTALPDGRIFINTSGNDGMATAGSGDSLTGILAALLARGCDPEYAGALAVYLHGKAGDAAAEKHGKSGMKAGDLIDGIRSAIPKER